MARSSDTFWVQRRLDTRRLMIMVCGEVDMAAAAALEAELNDAVKQSPEIAVDLHEATLIDSTGMHVLVNAQHAAGRGNRLHVHAAGNWLARVLDLTGVSALLGHEMPRGAADSPTVKL